MNEPPALSRPAPHVAQIELRRPQHGNRLEAGDLAVLTDHLEACVADADVRVVLLTAHGKHFCAGFDFTSLKAEIAAHDPRNIDEGAFERLANRLAGLRCATLVAVNGIAVGGATDLVLACDLRIGGPQAAMQMPAARFGLPLYASALERYVAHFGIDLAKRMVFTAQKIAARELQAAGVLQEIVEGERLAQRALEIAAEIAQLPPKPLAAMKFGLNAAACGQGNTEEVRRRLTEALEPDVLLARLEAMRAGGKS